ncbi:hypothetical protein [Kitasatospora sp. GP82]|uniref:hypothetical protein n=1 Tax=Kitasatospora sp. GP82 TaxID=3035089 RepID=UPI002473A9D7|nr:hypothetical protein [Kitasatospora sp. GP82]MDH6128124.1 hypothetical protein [Kitasatospora sp. GP82]
MDENEASRGKDPLNEEEQALLDERDRIGTRPQEDAAPPGLSCFVATVEGSAQEYASRLRAVLGAALDGAVARSGIGREITPRQVPEWFAAICDGQDGERVAPDFARRGSERYTAAGHGSSWDLPDWLDRFDPDDPFRTWSWWDLTQAGDHTLSLWVDAGGEDFFACDELRWAAYTSGAVSVVGPRLLKLDGWLSEPSV